MKLLHTTLLLLLWGSMLSLSLAQEETPDSVIYQGVEFIDGEWGEILALAELEGKTIFLDAYTDWCRPCKVMDKEVFTRPDVGDFFNDHFLNVKMNMEEGEGIALAEKYQILAYPTLLFLNYDGSVVHRFAGYKGIVGMMQLGRNALDNGNNIASLKEKYDAGERDPEFLLSYLQSSYEAADGQHVPIMEEYLATQKDWNTIETRNLIFQLLDTPNSKLFDHLIANKPAFVAQFGVTEVENQIQSLVSYELNKTDKPLELVDNLFQRAYPDRGKELASRYKMNYHSRREDGKGYAQTAAKYINDSPDISEEALNDIAWNYYDLVDNNTQIKILCQQLKKKTKQYNTYLNNESLALLYAKLGKKRKAKKLAKRAMAIAAKTKSSAASVQELIAELE